MKIFILGVCSLALISCATRTVQEDSAKDLYNKIDHLNNSVENLDAKIHELKLKNEEENLKIRNNQNKVNESFSKRVSNLEKFVEVQNILNEKIKQSVNDNRIYMVEVNQEFSDFRKSRIDSNSYYYLKTAAKHYKNKKNKKAHEIYSYYLKNPNLLNQNEYRMVFYRTALLEYRMGKYDESFVHFSQLYRNFHEKGDKYIASSLYHTGMILARDKKCSDAELIFKQVVSDYSNHQYFKELSAKRIDQIRSWKSCIK